MLPLDFSGYLQTAALGLICHFQSPFRHNVTAGREGVICFEIQGGEAVLLFRVREADFWNTQVYDLYVFI